MSDVSYKVRPIKREEVPQVLDIWRDLGLQEGTHCLYTWLQFDKEAIHVAVTDSGEVIGVCSAVLYNSDLAYVGLYAVKEKHRGLGVGTMVWAACMEHIGEANVVMNSLPEKVNLYQTRAGFPLLETKWMSKINKTSHTDASIDVEQLSDSVPSDVVLEEFKDGHLPSMHVYDKNLVGYDRALSLELNCKEKDSHTIVAFQQGKCVGFGTVKLSILNARQVGPLYADDSQVAEAILKKLLMKMPHVKDFAMMTISTNDSANRCIKRLGCPTAMECPMLYRKEQVSFDGQRWYLPSMRFYDKNLVGYDGALSLELNCKEKDIHTIADHQQGNCVGFGTVKLIGALYADDPQVAEAILKRFLMKMTHVKDFAMMTISTNDSANRCTKRLGGPTEMQCPMLYRKGQVFFNVNKLFAQWDLNFFLT